MIVVHMAIDNGHFPFNLLSDQNKSLSGKTEDMLYIPSLSLSLSISLSLTLSSLSFSLSLTLAFSLSRSCFLSLSPTLSLSLDLTYPGSNSSGESDTLGGDNYRDKSSDKPHLADIPAHVNESISISDMDREATDIEVP